MPVGRTFDVVVFGATGFAGRLVAEYLQDHHPGLKWAIAGRDAGKLEALERELAARNPDVRPSIRVADSHDTDALAALAAETRVVCTTVGPYAKHGMPLVAACVAAGTHVCDLTGEPQFVRRSIDAHHAAARATGVKVVHCCGFDSIPSDLGTLVLQQAAIEREGGPCPEVEMVVRYASGGFSGGTLASMANVLAEARDRDVRRVLADPYALCDTRGPDGREQSGPRWSAAAGVWTAPFVMAVVNEKVVRRSNELLGHRYGEGFRYHESMAVGRGRRGRLKAVLTTGAIGAFAAGLASRRVSPVLWRFLPAPGDGPSREAIEKGGFGIRLFGLRDGHPTVTVDVKGTRDPGYGATACMLAEAAVLLAEGGGDGEPGVGTPAASLGMPLVERLNARLVTFTVR
ncbi:MAG: saccharopine dehydrogenase NADP-binding domain-containing protein [Alphaproteobacteria bacterium]|nr:saccharopine dehydrogenase NADP-binding domain-containing protein [Alphaproteobacteria bacterium]